MTPVSNRLRSKVLAVAMGAAIQPPLLDGVEIFTEILGSGGDGMALQHFFKRLRHSRQGLRFLELCYRTDDPTDWASFLAHEQTKQESHWKDDVALKFCQRLPTWWSSEEATDLSSQINKVFLNSVQPLTALVNAPDFAATLGGWDLTPEEYRRWHLVLLRRVLRHLIREEGS